MEITEYIISIMAAWLLLAGISLWAQHESLGLSRDIWLASARAPVQLLLLALILHWLFDIRSSWGKAAVILGFCVMAGYQAASFHQRFAHAWMGASIGLAMACAATLPWLVFVGAFDSDARTVIPLGSMVVANGMNAVSIMLERLRPVAGVPAATIREGLRTAMIAPVNTLKMVGLVHMPGLFVGMILAGSSVFAAASAQLVVLYMIVASSFTACVVSFLVMKHLHKGVMEEGV